MIQGCSNGARLGRSEGCREPAGPPRYEQSVGFIGLARISGVCPFLEDRGKRQMRVARPR